MKPSKNIIGLILGPLVFSLILVFFEADGLSFEAKCILASTAWMAVWWVTECVPISVTALLPIVLFPLTGGMDLSTTTAAYGHKLVFLFVGGFMIAEVARLLKENKKKYIPLNVSAPFHCSLMKKYLFSIFVVCIPEILNAPSHLHLKFFSNNTI